VNAEDSALFRLDLQYFPHALPAKGAGHAGAGIAAVYWYDTCWVGAHHLALTLRRRTSGTKPGWCDPHPIGDKQDENHAEEDVFHHRLDTVCG